MAESEIQFSSVSGYPLIKFRGTLSVSSLNTFHLVLSGASEQGNVPIILDLTELSSISDGVKTLSCEAIGTWFAGITVVAVGPPDRLTKFKTVFGFPHHLRYATSVKDAVEELNKLPKIA